MSQCVYFTLPWVEEEEKKNVKVAGTSCETGTSRAPLQVPQGGKLCSLGSIVWYCYQLHNDSDFF